MLTVWAHQHNKPEFSNSPSVVLGFSITGFCNSTNRKLLVLLLLFILQSCPTLWDLMNCSPPGSSLHGIFRARILEWVAISFSRGFSQPRDQTWVSCIDRQILYHRATRKACEYCSVVEFTVGKWVIMSLQLKGGILLLVEPEKDFRFVVRKTGV